MRKIIVGVLVALTALFGLFASAPQAAFAACTNTFQLVGPDSSGNLSVTGMVAAPADDPNALIDVTLHLGSTSVPAPTPLRAGDCFTLSGKVPLNTTTNVAVTFGVDDPAYNAGVWPNGTYLAFSTQVTPPPAVITEPAPTVTLDSQGNLKATGKAPGVQGYQTIVYLFINGEPEAYTYAISPGSGYTLVDLLVVGRPTHVQVVAKVSDVSYTGPGASTIVYDQTLTALAPSTTPSAPSWTTATWDHKNGVENLPCSSQVHWVLTGKGITAAQVKVGSGSWANMDQNGEGSYGYTYPGAVTTNTVVQYRYAGVPTTKVVFTLSDCTTASPSPSVTPTPTPSTTPSAPVTSLPPAPSASYSPSSVSSATTPAQHLTSATTPAVVHTTTATVEHTSAVSNPLPHTGDGGTPQGSSLSLADDAGLALIALAVFIGVGVVLRKRYASHV